MYIKATAEAIWTAITDPEWTNRYGYKGYHHYDLRPGGTFKAVPSPGFRAEVEAAGYPCPDVLVDGEVIEADAPHRLVTTWRMLMDPTTAAEPMTTITYEIEQYDGLLLVDRGPRHDRRTGDGGDGPRRRRSARPGRRRTPVDPQRPQVAAGDRVRSSPADSLPPARVRRGRRRGW